MKYRQYIESNFLIDEPTTGQLVPFKFRKVQELYYNQLVVMGIEDKGLTLAIREFIVKARREGFSSLILALFAADDILQANPTETQVVSYKDDATNTFRKRYRRFVLCAGALKAGVTVEQIQSDPNILERFGKQVFSVDASDLELRHNRAHFYCGTAAARTGGRGGVLQKLLFSEAAHYQDTEKMTAKEVIDGTMRQVDLNSGWVFQESTGNGKGNYFYATFEMITRGLSRFMLRFFGWRDAYTEEEFKLISSEFTDPDMLKQEYPETVEEAFLSSNLAYTTRDQLIAMSGCQADKALFQQMEMSGVNYIDQCEIIKDYLLSLERSSPNRRMYVGIDSAKDVDKTVVTVLKENDLSTEGGIRGLAIDATGSSGDFMPDWFTRNSSWYVLRVKFSRPTKSMMYKNLRVVIQDRLTTLPEFMIGKEFISEEWEHFYKEMLDLQKQIIGEMLVVAHPQGNNYHDDYPDSWCLAEWLYLTLKGVPKGSRPPEEKTNFNASVRRMLDNNRANNPGGGGDDYI